MQQQQLHRKGPRSFVAPDAVAVAPAPAVAVRGAGGDDADPREIRVNITVAADGGITSTNVPAFGSPSFFAQHPSSFPFHLLAQQQQHQHQPPFLVCCIVNGLNNLQATVTPTATAHARSVAVSPAQPPRSSSSGGAFDFDESGAPKSRLVYAPERYANVVATSELQPVHAQLRVRAPRFNRKYEIVCITMAPTMLPSLPAHAFPTGAARPNGSAAGATASPPPRGGKHYAALLRLLFDRDPRVPLSEAEYQRAQREERPAQPPAAAAHNDGSLSSLNSNDESDNDTVSTIVAAGNAVVTAAADASNMHSGSADGTISGSPSLASSSGDTTPALLIIPPSRTYHDVTGGPAPYAIDPATGSFSGGLNVIRGATASRADENGGQRQPQQQFEIVHRLGPVQFLPPVESALFVHCPPSAMQLVICEVPDAELEQQEVILAQSVRDLLDTDEFEGSHPSSHVQNFMQYMPGYAHVVSATTGGGLPGSAEAAAAGGASAMGGTVNAGVHHGPTVHPNWNAFVDAHAGREWCMFRYTQAMVDAMALSGNRANNGLRAGEPRILSWRNVDRFVEADAAREQLRRSSEAQVRDALVGEIKRRGGGISRDEITQLLSTNRAFLSTMTPQLVKMLNTIEEDPRFVVLRSRLHPVIVEPNRNVAAAVERARREQQQQQQQQQL